MADLAHQLIQTVARAFYATEHILAIDALIKHSTLSDKDLATACSTQPKPLRKACGRLKEDGLVSVHTRALRRNDGTGSFFPGGAQPGKERLTHQDWYYINLHRAIDSIKYRMMKLSKFIENQGAPTTEKKDLRCLTKGCGRSYTELEVMDNIDMTTGSFLCPKCGRALEPVEEEERANENETMKRLNVEIGKLLEIMQKIDAASVPENDFETALSKMKPISRPEGQGVTNTEVVDIPNRNVQSTKGLEVKPEKIAVQVQDDEDVKRANAAADAQARREKEARQNALPDWIAKSTVSGDITAVGAKEEKQRLEREAHAGVVKHEEWEEKKPATDSNDDVMKQYWEDLEAEKQREAQQAAEDDDEEEDDEDEFEDVEIAGTPANGANGTAASSTGVNTPMNVESSNATDDERDAKRIKLEATNTDGNSKVAEDTPAASDEDEDEIEFEDV